MCVEHMERSSLDVEIHTLIMEDQQVMANFSYDGMDIHDLEAMLVYMDYPGHKGIWREGLMQWEIIVKLVFYILIFLVAIICNSLVLIVLVKKRSLRNVMHMFIINLAVADILVTLFAIWIDIVDDFAERWILGPFLCKFQPFIQFTSFVASVLTMTAIATERFFGIVMPFVFCTKKKEKFVSAIGFIWLVSILIAIPPTMYTGVHKREWRDHTEVACTPIWPDDDIDLGSSLNSRQLYYTVLAILLFFVPMTLMSLGYVAIILKLRAKQIQITELNNNPQKNKNSSRKRVAVMLVMLLVVFMLCWLPFQIAMLYYEYALHRQNSKLSAGWKSFVYFTRYMADANSAFNPVIFICFSQKIRKAIFNLLLCKKSTTWRRVNTGSSRAHSNRSSTKRTLV